MSELENNEENAIKVIKVIAKRPKGRPKKSSTEKRRAKLEYDRKYHAKRYRRDFEYKMKKLNK